MQASAPVGAPQGSPVAFGQSLRSVTLAEHNYKFPTDSNAN